MECHSDFYPPALDTCISLLSDQINGVASNVVFDKYNLYCGMEYVQLPLTGYFDKVDVIKIIKKYISHTAVYYFELKSICQAGCVVNK